MNAIRKKFDFPVPKDLRQSSKLRVYGIAIDGDDFVIEFVDSKDKIQRIKSYITGHKHDDVESVRKLVESKLSFFFDEDTTAYCTGRLTEIIDRLYDTEAAHAIEKVKKWQQIEAAKLDEEEKKGGLIKEKPLCAVKKYSGSGVSGLAEAVIIAGEPMFVLKDGERITFIKEIETPSMVLRPPGKQEYPPGSAYEFENEYELMQYIAIGEEEDGLYDLYRDVRKYYTKEYFVDTEARNSTLVALYTITSYFQDKFSTLPYIWLIGDNGAGKNSVLMTYAWLGYRVFYMAGASGANICEYLGTVEEGQGTIAEDENDGMDYDDYKRLLYMTGYASGNSIPKILDGNTSGREQRYYYSYCQKISASENLPSVKYSKGVLDRTLVVKCVKGFPTYNVKATKKRTKSPQVMRLIDELQTLRKRLFAYRLVHYDDTINEIQGINISGRALELTEPALLLFRRYLATEQDEKTFQNEILPTLSEFLNDRLSRRNDSFEARLYPIIKAMMDAQSTEELDNDLIFNTVMTEMGGKEIPGKSDMFWVDDPIGMAVSRTRILKVLREKFKAVPIRIILKEEGGKTKKGHRISMDILERIRASYEDEYDIKIREVLEDTFDRVNRENLVSDQYSGQNSCDLEGHGQPVQQEPQCEPAVTTITTDNPENDQKESLEPKKNSAPIITEPGLVGKLGQRHHIEEKKTEQVGSDQQLRRFIKCPHPGCRFKNVYQESVDHHAKYKHGYDNN